MQMAGIPKIVEQQLHAMATLEDHPDPNLLGAFVEKSLAQHEQVRVLDHLSRCTNCREIVSLTATQPGIAGAVSVVPARVGWLSWPVLRWGAAVACVVVVGAAVTLRQQHESRQIETTVSEQKSDLKSRSLCRAIRRRAAEETVAAKPTVTRQIPELRDRPKIGPRRRRVRSKSQMSGLATAVLKSLGEPRLPNRKTPSPRRELPALAIRCRQKVRALPLFPWCRRTSRHGGR